MEEREHVPDPVELYANFMQKRYGKDFNFWWENYFKLGEKKGETWRKLEVNRTFFDGETQEEYIQREIDPEKIRLWKIYKRIKRKQDVGVTEYLRNLRK